MKRIFRQQRGQALVLIVLAIVGMVAITGLAIDGGNAYAERRRAQNAADTAAMGAALARVRQDPAAPADAWRAAGYTVAANNGYGPGSTVVVSLCSDSGITCPLPATIQDENGDDVATDPSQFVKVTITSTIRTYFAAVVGIRQLTNQVDAIVRAVPAYFAPYFNGSPLASVMPHCKRDYPNWNSDPFVVGGSAKITVTGGVVFDNSDCEPDFDSALSTGGYFDSAKGIWLRGTYNRIDGVVQYPAPNDIRQHYGPYIDPNSYAYPELDDQCAALGTGRIDQNADGTYTAYPGRYNNSFPSQGGGSTVYLARGLYCLKGGLDFQTGTMTTDIPHGATPPNGHYDLDEGVLFYLPTKGVSFSGNATVKLHAITTNTCPQTGQNGLLIYLPVGNDSTVKVAGGNGSTYTGSIIAPSSLVQITGSSGSSSDTLTLETQIIGFSISLGGSGYVNINFDECNTPETFVNPQLQPYK